jgi:putative ABC transport system permease protein
MAGRILRTASDIARDLRHAARLLAREPGYTAVALLGIALGIGATTTLFSVAYGVLLKPLPWPEPERLVRLEERRGGRPGRVPWTITNGTYLAWTEAATVEDVGGWMSVTSTFSDGREPERIRLGRLTPTVFTVLQARALMGRVFEAADAGPKADTVILSHAFWQRRFGGAPGILGSSIRLDERAWTVIGVMPSAFAFPDRETQAWIPAYISPVYSDGGARISLQIFGAIARMRPGVTAAQVAAEGTARARAGRDPGTTALALFGSAEPPTITAMPALEVAIADVRPAIRVMVAAVVLLFATAMASVVVVQLARVARRRREMALRAALGASTARLARQWLTESVAIGVAGGLLGMAGARLLVGLLPAILPADFPRLSDITLDWRVGLASAAATLAAIAACALFPAMHARVLDITRALADDASPIGAGMRTPAARLRSAIMAGQVAVACVLLIGGGLLGRSFQALTNVDRGYDPENLLTARLPLPSGPTFAKSAAMFESIKERMRTLPGVTHAAFGNALPLVSAGGMTGLNVRLPRDPATESKIQALHRTVDPDYFGAMGLRLVAGRLLSDSDSTTAQPVLVVNRSFADQYLGADPVGRRLTLNLYRRAEWEIVGVVEDMKQGGLQTGSFVATTDAAQPEMFSSYRQFGEMRLDTVFFLARAQSDPSRLVPSVRALVREQAPALVLDSVMTMEERVMASLSRPRAYALVVGVMAAFALAIACVGLFGVLSYSVAQRTREIGVRTALGATIADVITLVLRSGLAIVAAGLAGGLAAAGLLAQSLSKILYGVGPFDPVTFAVVPVFLVLAATVACVAPARRAARIDPLRALRAD